jgi:FKBP-type peptidyl-prolyl cis-trans isomerase FkpA
LSYAKPCIFLGFVAKAHKLCKMTKNVFIYIIVFVLIGIAAWFFIDKSKQASKNSDLGALVPEEKSTETPMPDSNNSEKWVKLSSGLQILDVMIGPGKEAKEGDIVSAHYTGTFSDGRKFDSSYDHGQPFSFPLGGGMVIKGWDMGLVGMKVGGKRKLIIPPDLGYGPQGSGPIPGNTTLYFDIELVDAQTPTR